MWDPRRLVVLRAVAEHRSFTLAAQELFTTQPAVSRQIAALERELGVTLVVRGSRQVSLSGAGTELLEKSGQVLAGLAAVERRMHSIAGGDGGVVRLGAVPSAMADLVPAAVLALRRRRPKVEITVEEGWSPDLLIRLRAGEADAVVVADLETAIAPVEPIPLLTEVFDVLLPAPHPLCSRRRLRMTDLADEPFVLAPGAAGQRLVRAACAEAGFAPNVAGTATWDAAGALVAAGIGIALVPRSTARRLAVGAAVEAHALHGAPRRQLHLLHSGLSAELSSNLQGAFSEASRGLR